MSEMERCPICLDLGYLVRRDGEPGTAGWGDLIPCSCQAAARGERLRSNSGLLPKLSRMTFETFRPGRHRIVQRAKEEAQRYAVAPGSAWLLFQGPAGQGKTHLAAAICNERLRHGLPVRFAVVPDLLGELRGGFDEGESYERRLERMVTCPFLVLDDLGAEKQTDWVQTQLYLLLNGRLNRDLPLVMTSNLKQSEYPERIQSRVFGEQTQVYDFPPGKKGQEREG